MFAQPSSWSSHLGSQIALIASPASPLLEVHEVSRSSSSLGYSSVLKREWRSGRDQVFGRGLQG